jgi:Tfp pilus assembly protein PilF
VTLPASTFDDTAGAASGLSQANPYLQQRQTVPAEAQRLFARAQELIASEDWHGAALELQALAESYPQLSGVCLDLALVYRQLGDMEQAQLWFKRSIASNARNIDAYNEYGIFLREQGQFAEAEAIYLMALEQWDASSTTHRNIGILYDLYLGEPQKALQHYRRYQVLNEEADPEVAAWIVDLQSRARADTEMARS